jgi:hypothetical protein
MTSHVRKRKQSVLGKNRRRKHQHWETTIYYGDGEKFSRVYIDEDRASHFCGPPAEVAHRELHVCPANRMSRPRNMSDSGEGAYELRRGESGSR